MNLEHLPTFSPEGDVNVIVETPRGSRNKYSYDPESGVFLLKKMLPLGMRFPFDFGFIPGTQAEDGDPLDALILADETLERGTLVRCVVLGVIEASQGGGKTRERNDRIVVLPALQQGPRAPTRLKDVDPTCLDEIEAFFIHYTAHTGTHLRIENRAGPKRARELIEAARTH